MSYAAFYTTQEIAIFVAGRLLYDRTGDKSQVNAAVAALDAVSGPTWQKQFREERRVDPSKLQPYPAQLAADPARCCRAV